MPTISSSPRVPDASGLDRENLRIKMASALECCPQITDRNMRRCRLRTQGILEWTEADERDAVARVQLKRRMSSSLIGVAA